jgi:hypothetical protein
VSWFNTYDSDGNGLTRVVRTTVDLDSLPLNEWTLDELGFRLAVIYPQVDGHEHLTASQEVRWEVAGLMQEIERRGFNSSSNLMFNERNTGWGWLPGFRKLKENTNG